MHGVGSGVVPVSAAFGMFAIAATGESYGKGARLYRGSKVAVPLELGMIFIY